MFGKSGYALKLLANLRFSNNSLGYDKPKKIYEDNITLLGEFNVEPEEAPKSEFLNIYSLKNLVSQKTCLKNP